MHCLFTADGSTVGVTDNYAEIRVNTGIDEQSETHTGT